MAHAITSLIFITVVIASLIGYSFNIAKFCKCDFQAPYNKEIVRSVGVLVPPAGFIIGYININ